MQKIKTAFEIRVRLSSFNCLKLDAFKKQWKKISLKYKLVYSSINLPVDKKKFTMLKSPHVNKRSKDQFEIRISGCLIILKGLESDFNFALFEEFAQIESEDVSTKLIFVK
jgi:small subunit ribosomal protein S10